MDRHHIFFQARLIAIFLTLFTTTATAVSLDFNTRTVCKSKDRIVERAQLMAGIVSTLCVVDIRQSDIKEYMIERIKSGESASVLPPAFTGVAGSQLILTPTTNQAPPAQSDNNSGSIADQFSQPFTSLTRAMADFTGNDAIALDLGDNPHWLNLPPLNNQSQYRIQNTLSMQSANAIPQAVVPLPAAGILFISGLLAYSGLVWHGRRRSHTGTCSWKQATGPIVRAEGFPR